MTTNNNIAITTKIGSSEMAIKKLFINNENLEITDNPEWKEPEIGEHIEITSWDRQDNVQECVRLSKLPYLTISNVNPVIMPAPNGEYHWGYEVEVKESHLKFLQVAFKSCKKDNFMKIADLPEGYEMRGLKIRTKNGVVGYYVSTFNQGIILSQIPNPKEGEDRLYPQVVETPDNWKQWEIIQDENVKTNCNTLTSLKYTLNK